MGMGILPAPTLKLHAYLVACIVGYLMGSISNSRLVSSFHKVDIVRVGTANPGATNVFLSVGKAQGFLVMFMDIGKTVFAVWICANFVMDTAVVRALAGGSAVLGHLYPVFYRFRGGKGLACLGGTALSMDWRTTLVLAAVIFFVVWVLGHITYLPLMAAGVAPIAFGCAKGSFPVFLILAVPCVLMLLKHRENLVWLREARERRALGQ